MADLTNTYPQHRPGRTKKTKKTKKPTTPAKSKEQLVEELHRREQLGEFNSFKRSIDAVPAAFAIQTNASTVVPSIIDRVIGESSTKTKSDVRLSVCVAKRPPSYLETLQINMGAIDSDNLKKVRQSHKAMSTRCAEGPERAAHPPYCYDSGDLTRRIMTYIHPQAIIKNDAAKLGSEVYQTYTNDDKNMCKIDKVLGHTGLTADFVIPPPVENWGGAMSVFIDGVPVPPAGGFYESSELSSFPISVDPPAPAVKHITEELNWQMEFNPLATGTKKNSKIHCGSKFALKPGRKDPMGSGTIRPHSGIDCWVSALMPIVAPAAGTIRYITSPKRAMERRYKAIPNKNHASKGFAEIKPIGAPTTAGASMGMNHPTGDKDYKVYTGYCHIVRVGNHPTEKDKDGKPRLLRGPSDGKPGDTVPAGHVIAYVGGGNWGYTTPNPDRNPAAGRLYCSWPGSGGSTGVHLHFGVQVVKGGKKVYVDPLSFKYKKVKRFSDAEITEIVTENQKYLDNHKTNIVKRHIELFGPLTQKKKR